MRILVIGGTQFIGRHTTQKLAGLGHDVSVLHRRDHHDLGPDIRNLQADRGDVAAVTRLIREHDFEVIFDFAYDWQRGTPAAHVEAAASACGDTLQRYVFMSSIAVYGGGIDLQEDHPLAPDDHPEQYVRHKAAAERVLFRMNARTQFPVTTLRPPFVHGPLQPFYREQFFWDRLLDGRPIILPDGGDTPLQWAYVADVAEVCVRSMSTPAAAGEAFNVAHAGHTTQRGFVEALARVAGVEPRFVAIPRETIFAAGGHPFKTNLYFGEFLDMPPHTSSIEKAARLLDFTPTNFETALRAGFEWYVEQPRRTVDYAFEDRLLVDA
jgi:2'-hydroxyisoflavone reductase